MPKPLVLIVDRKDDAEILSSTLRAHYRIGIVDSGEKALRFAKRQTPDLILLDKKLSRLADGRELCMELRREKSGMEELPIIFAIHDRKEKPAAFKLGADGCLEQPFQPEEVAAEVNLRVTLRQSHLALKRQNEILEEQVRERTQYLRETRLEIVERLARTAEYRDPDTGMHIIRMARYSAALGRAAGLKEEDCELLLNAAPMHDVGKVGIPDKILLKPGRHTREETKIMQTHAGIGEKILAGSSSELLQMASEIAATHHEKWNGFGYPRGLKGEEIPLWGRIVAVSDVFDALTMKRPYKKAWPVEKALTLLEEESGKHFQPHLITLFLKIPREIQEIMERFSKGTVNKSIRLGSQ